MKPEIELVRQWVEHVVVGLNLCPFASPVFEQDSIRYSLCELRDSASILELIQKEFETLDSSASKNISTTIIILPLLSDFEVYLDLLDLANIFLEKGPYLGQFQIASFHPHYVFEGETADSRSNFTNRAPYPILHLIREEDVSRAAKFYGDIDEIPRRNVDLLNSLSAEEFDKIFSRFKTKVD